MPNVNNRFLYISLTFIHFIILFMFISTSVYKEQCSNQSKPSTQCCGDAGDLNIVYGWECRGWGSVSGSQMVPAGDLTTNPEKQSTEMLPVGHFFTTLLWVLLVIYWGALTGSCWRSVEDLTLDPVGNFDKDPILVLVEELGIFVKGSHLECFGKL